MSHVCDNRWLQILDSSCCRDQLRTSVLTYLPDRMLSVSIAIWNDVSVAFTDVNIQCSLLHSPTQRRTGKYRKINIQFAISSAKASHLCHNRRSTNSFKMGCFVCFNSVACVCVCVCARVCVCVCVCVSPLTLQFSTSGRWKGNTVYSF